MANLPFPVDIRNLNFNDPTRYFSPILGMFIDRPPGATNFLMHYFSIECFMFNTDPDTCLELQKPEAPNQPLKYRFEGGYATLLWKSYLRITRTLSSLARNVPPYALLNQDFHFRSVFQEPDKASDDVNNPFKGVFTHEQAIQCANTHREVGLRTLAYIDDFYRDAHYFELGF